MKKTPSGKNLIIKSAFFLLLSLLIMVSAVFAWFTASFNTTVSPFVVKVTRQKSDLTYTIEGVTQSGNSLILNNASPGVQYKFLLSVKNESGYDSQIYMYFKGFTPPVTVSKNNVDIVVDMRDIFMIKYTDRESSATISEEYFRDLYDSEGNVVVFDGPIAPYGTVDVEFYLVFSNTHTYKNTEGQYVAGDINLFQGRDMKISNLVVELN